jgi:adenine-specific DNA methylase
VDQAPVGIVSFKEEHPMTDRPRLIEVAFPLKQTSLDSVHEKNVRHGHISTLHIWPARRPLAACRAALIATLLPDPGTPEARRALCERIGGKVVKVVKKKATAGGKTEERLVEETVGGVLHWGRETENKADIEWFRQEIRKAYGGRAPKVLDPFAGGGAIPLEAMRLGCEATAIDINPVAWFILKCTLEYPQKLAGQTRRLPDFALRDAQFMESFFTAQGFKKPQVRTFLKALGMDDDAPGAAEQQYLAGMGGVDPEGIDPSFLEADLAWHVRAWGRWVLARARKDLAEYYPITIAFQPLKDNGTPYKARPEEQIIAADGGAVHLAELNAEFTELKSPLDPRKAYLDDKRLPRWISKPTVAYLWARTVKCKNCRATIPLLKTRWLAKKGEKRVLLKMEPNADKTGVVFEVQSGVSQAGGNNAIRREHDKKLGAGTMSRAGVWCPCCGKPGTVAMEMEDIRQEGLKGGLGAQMTAVVVDGPESKEYRLPTTAELRVGTPSEETVQTAFEDVPFGVPEEPLPGKDALGIRVPLYGFDRWRKLFTARHLVGLSTLVVNTRAAREAFRSIYPRDWTDAVGAYLACGIDRLLDFANCGTQWKLDAMTINHSFVRFALPITWDYAEGNLLGTSAGSYLICQDRVATALDTFAQWSLDAPSPNALRQSATKATLDGFDVVVTDPPYYDAIPYSDLMDFFYVWLRRTVWGWDPAVDAAFKEHLAPKWDEATDDGELIDDSSRHGGDAQKSKDTYERGMAKAFAACSQMLRPDGHLVVVFANKQPDAWETLVAAIIRAGFVVEGSWPIQTEQATRMRAIASAALASSVWLVCKKRVPSARPGWDRDVLKDMQSNIYGQLRSFWDAGIRGPDFVWAATGPAMEAYSKHPIVKKADTPGELMSVSEFLRAVRRIVVDFVVGRVLTREEEHASEDAGSTGDGSGVSLDDVTTYYLLHRHDFGMDDAPAGACILYAVSCNLSESELADRFDILNRTGGVDADDDGEPDDGDADAEAEEGPSTGTGSTFKLKSWKQRNRPGMGTDTAADTAKRRAAQEELQPRLIDGTEALQMVVVPRSVPLIDQVHRLMHLWVAGDLPKVNQYIEDRGLRRNTMFHKLLQAIIELSPEGSEERSRLEQIMNHFRDLGVTTRGTMVMKFMKDEEPANAGAED